MNYEFRRIFGSQSSGHYVYVGIHPDFATADQALKGALPEMHPGVKVFIAGQESPGQPALQCEPPVQPLGRTQVRSLVVEILANGQGYHPVLNTFHRQTGTRVLVAVESDRELPDRVQHILFATALDGGIIHVPPD